jgi:hypothetical protein
MSEHGWIITCGSVYEQDGHKVDCVLAVRRTDSVGL